MKKTKHYTGHRWTTQEIKDLMQLWDKDATLQEIAELLNVTTTAVLKMVLRLRKEGIPLRRRTKGHQAGQSWKPWTQAEVEYLVRRRAEKATCEEIAADLGRSWNAVNCMIGTLRKEGAPVAMRGMGVRRLWNVDALKAQAVRYAPDELKVIQMDQASAA